LGYTGTLLANAAKHGKILTNLALARPGDPIVIGPGTGWHTTICVEAGADPIVVSHGSEYAALLIVISGAAYKLSRGLAKVGSPPALEGTPGLSPTEPPQDGTTEPPA
jgi:hypothetical protein